MSTCYYLVSLKTMQAVHIATRGGGFGDGYVHGPDNNNAVGLFCIVRDHSDANLMSEQELEKRDLCHDELTYWTSENFRERYTAITGEAQPELQ